MRAKRLRSGAAARRSAVALAAAKPAANRILILVDESEKYLQGRIAYLWEDEHRNAQYYKRCEEALNWFIGKKSEIVAGNPLSTD